MGSYLVTGAAGFIGSHLCEGLLKKGYNVLGDNIFNTWSCYSNEKVQCGKCESCNNRKAAFLEANIEDKTVYRYD